MMVDNATVVSSQVGERTILMLFINIVFAGSLRTVTNAMIDNISLVKTFGDVYVCL